jgi:glycosyltransferase involved in cell wall biosynthesis
VTSNDTPLVSILIRSMDRPTLQRALDSAARQTWPNLEIVVVAACGDVHRPLPDQHNGRPLRLINSGEKLTRPMAANAALDAALGEWLNFLDDDDELLPEHVRTLMSAPRPSGERVVFSRTRVIDANGKTLGHVSHAGNRVQLFTHSRATVDAMLFHRSLVDEGARFDPAFLAHEDHDFQVNCATRTDFVFVNRATAIWHAQLGESGSGFGGNDDRQQRADAIRAIRAKWSSTFDEWLRDFDDVLFTGQQYLKGGDVPAARRCLEVALALRPRDVNALNLCGMANFHTGNIDRAEQLLTIALHRAPDNRLLQENLALIQARRAAAVR